MLSPAKKSKLLLALKTYRKKFLEREMTELDESGTRLMINSFLSEVLGYLPIEEIRTEYMIKGTYADYMIQMGGVRHFLIEVKAYSLQLSEKHLRQAVNYGANEGIEWALLTNGKQFDFYKIIFGQPIGERKIFSVDLSNAANLKHDAGFIQYLHKEAVLKKSLKQLWSRCEALDPVNVAGIIYSKEVLTVIKKLVKNKYCEKCDDEEIVKSLNRIVQEKIDPAVIRPYKTGKVQAKTKKATKPGEETIQAPVVDITVTAGEEGQDAVLG